MYAKGDRVVLSLESGRRFRATVVEGQKNLGDAFVARLDEGGVCVNVDPAEVYVERKNNSEEEAEMHEVATHVEEPVVIRSGMARGRKKVVITQETIEAFSRWVDVELPNGSRIQAQFRMLPSGTAGIMRVRLAFLTLSVTVYQSKQDVDDIYIPPTKTSYSTRDGDTREVTVIEADETQSELLKAIAAAVMSELGLSFKPATRANSPTRGGGAHPVGSKAVSSGRRFSR